MNKVSKALLRSLLKWSRQEEVRKVPFTIVPSEFGCDEILPKEAVICDASGVKKAVLWAFRNSTYSNENLDNGFATLKSLNAYSLKLKDMLSQHNIHGNEMFFRHAKFRIGQIVEHKETHVRGVVVGWEVDAAVGKQDIEVLVDLTDVNELSARAGGFKKLLPASAFTLVHDRSLQRIQNNALWGLFTEYDEAAGRYTPSVELLYTFPRDCDDTLFASPWFSLEGQMALRTVKAELHDTAQALVRLQQQHFPAPPVDAPEEAHLRHRIAQQVLDEFFAQVRNFARTTSTKKEVSSTTPGTTKEVRMWRRGVFPAPLYGDAKRCYNEVNTTFEGVHCLQGLITALDQIVSLRFQSLPRSLDLLPNPLDNTPKSADPSSLESSPDPQIKTPARYALGQVVRHGIYQYRGVVCGYDLLPTTDTSNWYPDTGKDTDGTNGKGTGNNHGLVRPHYAQPYYKVIPDEGDVLRLLGPHRVRGWYYIAEDQLTPVTEPSELPVSHPNLYRYFLPYDTGSRRFGLPHALQYCFPCAHHAFPPDYPATTPRRAWRNTHAHSPESDEEVIGSLSYTIGCEATDDEELRRVRQVDLELGIYEALDTYILSCYYALKSRHAAGRQAYASASPAVTEGAYVRQLLAMLRHAPSAPYATSVEHLLWHVTMAHATPGVNASMRQGFAALRGGDAAGGVAHFRQAVAQDGMYGEAHGKLAAALCAQKQYAACCESAQQAVTLFPGHFGSLAGMGLALDHLQKQGVDMSHYQQTTESVYREALSHHPWATALSTALQLIRKTKQEEQQEKSDNNTNTNADTDSTNSNSNSTTER